MFDENKLNPGDGEATGKFSRKFIVLQKLVEDYVDHLGQRIEMRKEKGGAESERQRTQRLEQYYNDIDGDHFYNSNQVSSLKVHELNFYHSCPIHPKLNWID